MTPSILEGVFLFDGTTVQYSSMDTTDEFLVDPTEAGVRLDRFLTTKTKKSRSFVQKLIREGRVQINHRAAASHDRVAGGEAVSVAWPGIVQRHEELVPRIVAETAGYLVVDKPAGLLAHGTPSRRETSLVDWLRKLVPDIDRVGEAGRPGIVHRLDRDVSGLMVIAKTPEAFESLQEQFRHRTVAKTYTAVVVGSPADEEGEIRFRLARSRRSRGRMAARPEGAVGKEALTQYVVERRFRGAALLRVKIVSGRTHQIRAHLFALNLPILGDRLYKAKKATRLPDPGRPFLHATDLSFFDQDGVRQSFHAPLPAELQTVLDRLEQKS